MAIIFAGWLAIGSVAEHQANPAVAAAGVAHQPGGNVEGKEVRFGDTSSAFYNVAATQTSTGAVNSAMDSYTPVGGFATLTGMMLGEISPSGRGKAQASTLRKMRTETGARRLRADGAEERGAAGGLAKGDLVVGEARDVIPSDGEIIEGKASVDESAITGESAPVIREAGGDRSAVTGGATGLSDRLGGPYTAGRGHTVLALGSTLGGGGRRRETPHQ